MKRLQRKRPRLRINTGPCSFCESKTAPYYAETEPLLKHINERAKIKGRSRTGLCLNHQRRLATAIKRARHLALIPFVGK